MIKKAILVAALILFANWMLAQDQLFKRDNTKLLVKITEIGPELVKYKLFDNKGGPIYVLNKSEVILIIYENGNHEVIATNPSVPINTISTNGSYEKSSSNKIDSISYYKHSQSISVNFLNFVNSEFGIIYQREFYKKSFNLLVPFAIGLGEPAITESVYFNKNDYYYSNTYSYLNLNRKLFEFGLGFNYYPSLKYSFNYYIGPMLKFMQYSANQFYNYSASYYYQSLEQTTTLNRITASITNGLMFRTKGRLVLNLFASLGFKYDELTDKLIDPTTQQEINFITKPFQLYFWGGTCVGFCF